MAKLTFKGGIHIYDGKNLSKDKPITDLSPKGDLVLPLLQHIGAPAKPLVKKGDQVSAGQKIAEADGPVSANIISPVSGTVKAIEKRITATGRMEEAIIIANDNEYRKAEGFGQERDYTRMSKKEIRDAVKEAGIVGLGGAGFPPHVKLTPGNDDKIEYVIVNGAECEPYLTSNYRLMLEEPEKIIGGLKIMLRLFENSAGIIAIEDNKPDVINKFKELTANEEKIQIKSLKTKYPQGGERQLIYALTGRKLNSKKIPADVGCIVNNAATVAAIYMAVAKTTPLTHMIVTVSGDAVAEPQNFRVPIGMDFGELVEAAGGFKTLPQKIVFGGPMMGTAMYTYSVPVTKTTSALLGFIKDEAAVAESICIRCGKCHESCPLNLMPIRLFMHARYNEYDMFEKNYGMECCGCGCCSYVCPAKKSLTQTIVQTKQRILAKKNGQQEVN